MTEQDLLNAGFSKVGWGSRIQIWEKHEGPVGLRVLVDEVEFDSETGEVRDLIEGLDPDSLEGYENKIDYVDVMNALAGVPDVLKTRISSRLVRGTVRTSIS